MTTLAIIALIEKYGPDAMRLIPLLQKLYADVTAGKGEKVLTDADWSELTRLCGLSSVGIYAKEGVALPP